MKIGLDMDENSLEYQQLMSQIEEHEIDYVNADTVRSGYEIKTGWVWGGMIFLTFCILGLMAAMLSSLFDT
jgi:hypothetical protein